MKYDMATFDVNETLLDISGLAPLVEEAAGPGASLGEWFARLLHRSLVANHLGRYQPFGELAVESLEWMALRSGASLDVGAVDRLLAAMTRLPPHPDVVEGLERLAATGLRLVALTNGSADALAAQLDNAGIERFFDARLSVEGVRRFKPAPEVYLHAAAVSGVDIDRMVMVAAHDWDIAGAQSVGASGCFIARQPWGIRQVEPTHTASDLVGLAELLAGPESDGVPAR